MNGEIGCGLTDDIVASHGKRVQNLKKYYPFFCLQSANLGQWKDGRYAFLDLGYIFMALLRFFIEENNFKEQEVVIEQVHEFLTGLLRRDFGLAVPKEEEKELTAYLFDKIRNNGKPFQMDYFDPADKKRKVARIKLIDSSLSNGTVVYYATADAIEFYLDTKEIKEESKINIEQLLLGKMIQAQDFKGAIDMVRRINGEVNKLRRRKKEVLMILSSNVFEGVKALEEFNLGGIRWFKEEQNAFQKNNELIGAARRKAEAAAKIQKDILQDISLLESELGRAMINHGKLLADCMELQVRADEMIHKYKFSRLKTAFDFQGFVQNAMEADDPAALAYLVLPLLPPRTGKYFALSRVDDLCDASAKQEEMPEVAGNGEEADYCFEDEVEEKRIDGNYRAIATTLLDTLLVRDRFDLKEFNIILETKFFGGIFQNSDYYSFFVHLCQKREYDLSRVREKQDTFFEKFLAKILEEEARRAHGYRAQGSKKEGRSRYEGLKFRIALPSDRSIAEPEAEKGEEWPELTHSITGNEKESKFTTSNIWFSREDKGMASDGKDGIWTKEI